jgi:hypothetical protein
MIGSGGHRVWLRFEEGWVPHRRKVVALIAVAALPAAAHAKIPLINATCAMGMEVHADEGGPIFLNGKEAKLKVFNKNYYEAKSGAITISLSMSPDGSPQVSWTGKGREHGICQVKE